MKIHVYIPSQGKEILTYKSDSVPRVGDHCLVNNKQCYCRFVVTEVRWDLSIGDVTLFGESV